MSDTTEIRIDERGDETHESWLLIRANHVSCSPPGANLFDSELRHQHLIMVVVSRCTRKRQLNRDWLHGTEVVLEMEMSQAQWGAFVSSFGQGGGVPATLTRLLGERVPQAPVESRFDQSHQEVREAGTEAIKGIQESYAEVMATFDAGGKKALREALRSMGFAIKNAPANMEFAAQSLTEHVENVVTKARADIEGMALAAAEQGRLGETTAFQLGSGEDTNEHIDP